MRSDHPDLGSAPDQRPPTRPGLRDLVRQLAGVSAGDEPALVAALRAALFHRVPLSDLVVSARSPGKVRGLHASWAIPHPVDLDWPCELGSPGEARAP